MEDRKCAIIIADDHYNGLGVIRSLGESGITVILLMFQKPNRSIIHKSKYVSAVFEITKSEEVIAERVNAISNEYAVTVVYPVSDYAALICDKYRYMFNDGVIVPHAYGKLEQYENKFSLSKIAESKGVLCPKHIVTNTQTSSEVDWEIFPAIIKPLLSVEGKKTDIVIVNNKIELIKELNDFYTKGYKRVLLEQYIHGKEEYMLEILGCTDGNGDIRLSNLIRKIREYPISNGSTAYAEICDSYNPINIDAIRDLINETGFSGLFDLEFKYSDGEAFFIEMNFRNGAPSYAFTQRKFNIPYMWYCMVTGEKYKSVFQNNNPYLMIETYDVINALKRETSLRQWLSDFKKSQRVIWVKDDWRPSWGMYFAIIKVIFRKVFHFGK